MINTEKSIAKLANQLSDIGPKILDQRNIELVYDLAQKLNDSPQLFEKFKVDPNSVVTQVIPEFDAVGVHFHAIDGENNYMPAEGDAIQQILNGQADPEKVWTRLELRFGIQSRCIAVCLFCE